MSEIVRKRRAGAKARGALDGRHVLVTAGPTRAPIDRVRYIANHSTGATGVAIAETLLRRGAQVHLVYGPGAASPPRGVDLRRVETPDEMRRAALDVLQAYPIAAAVLAAAVLDYVPKEAKDEKIASGGTLTIEFVATPKLIDELVRAKPEMITIGFKLEYRKSDEELIAIARSLLERDRLSAVLANDLARMVGTAHPALLITADGRITRVAGNAAIAAAIADHLEKALT